MSDAKYYFAVNDQQRGPIELAELIALRLPGSTLVWREGMSDWQRMDSLAEFSQSPGTSAAESSPPPVTPPPIGAQPFTPPPMSPPYASPIGYGSAPPRDDSKRIMAGIFGIVMGGLGIHKFILGYTGAGLIMLLITIFTCGWGGIVFHVIGLIEGIIYLTKGQEEFYQTYVVNRREWF